MGAAELNILLLLLDRAYAFSQKVRQARAEGRKLTKEELDAFEQEFVNSDEEVLGLIAEAKAEGR